MLEKVADEVLAKALEQAGVVSSEQLQSAKAVQAERNRHGNAISLGEMLIQQGVITQAILRNVAKRVHTRPEGPLKQLGKFKIIKKIGSGGMGQVFLAEDTMLFRHVAIKILSPQFASQGVFLKRFRREAMAAGHLNHPNIVAAFSVDEEAGTHYLAMEYCDGETLDKMVKRLSFLPEENALRIAESVCRGLLYAHEHGIVHRDIKPGNIAIKQDGTVKILDLGLAKNLDETSASFQTGSGQTMGSPHYISPEQALGKKDLDGRTDIYSLGATLYHLVTGQTPFHGKSTAEIVAKHLSEQLPDPRDMNPDLSSGATHIIGKAMAKAPEDRYASCAEMLEDLELVQRGDEPSSVALDVMRSSVAVRVRLPDPRVEAPRRDRPPTRGEGVKRPPGRRTSGPVPPVGTRRHEAIGTHRHEAVARRQQEAATMRPDGTKVLEREETGRSRMHLVFLIAGVMLLAIAVALLIVMYLNSGGAERGTKPRSQVDRSGTRTAGFACGGGMRVD